MKQLTPHPLAELFPPMDDETFKALVADIRQNGLREAIFLWDGQILDGRNRYRACAEIGITPITRHWDGPGDPLDFVVSKNLHRRHLSDGQRAAVAAEVANMKQGARTDLAPIGARSPEDAAISQSKAAKMLNVSRRSVQRAQVVLDKGVPELHAAVKAGHVSVNAAAAVAYNLDQEEQREIVSQGPAAVVQAAKAARATRSTGPNLTIVAPTVAEPKTSSPRAYITVPDGATVESQARKGITLEADGLMPEKAAKEIGIGVMTYRYVRDLITLLEEIDLVAPDRQIVANALGAINETRQVGNHDSVDPIFRRVWGSKSNNHHTVKTARKRVDHFATVVGIAVQSCSNFELEEFEIPYLSDDETKRWLKELEAARRSIDAFLKKLKSV